MTPDVVLQRFIQITDESPIDRQLLLGLVSADADLLGRWLTVFRCPASPTDLARAIGPLDDAALMDLSQAQALALLPPVGTARLSIERWQRMIVTACAGELLAERLGLPDPDGVRWRVLLGASGVNLPHDVLLDELMSFRGAPAALFEDAPPLHRVLAVAEATDPEKADSGAPLAEALLSIPAGDYPLLVERAVERARQLVGGLGLPDDSLEGAADDLWRRQQVASLSVFLADGSRSGHLSDAHRLAAASLFDVSPQLWVARDQRLVLDEPPLSIGSTSTTSQIARAFQTGDACPVQDAFSTAVIDRQALRTLGVERGWCVPLRSAEGPVAGVLMVPLAEDQGPEEPVMAYARALGRWLLPPDGGGAGDAALRQFRDLEEKRLREIVHEANNPLSVVQNYLHILNMRLENDTSVREHLDIIASEIRRATEIIRRASSVPAGLELPGPEPGQDREVDVNALVDRIATLHEGAARASGVTVHRAVSSAEIVINTDADRLMQVLTNLARNAVEAMPDGGLLTLTTDTGIIRSGRRVIEILIRDTGPGLPEPVVAELFEPKDASAKGGDHAGLGLYVAHRLMGELDGEIDVRSDRNGTQFRLYLPNR